MAGPTEELIAKNGGDILNKICGMEVSFFVQQETPDKLENLQLYPMMCAWVVTYPKCGTTWMQQIVRLIRNQCLPNTTPCKYIYVMRYPKDVAVSCHFHHLLLPDYDWETFWKKFIEGEVEYGNYFDHLLSWWSHRDDENVLFMKYEDMKKDLPAAVSQVASFIGADISSDVIIPRLPLSLILIR